MPYNIALRYHLLIRPPLSIGLKRKKAIMISNPRIRPLSHLTNRKPAIRLILGFAFFSSSSILLAAQDYPRKDVDPEWLVEELFPLQELDINYQELYENLLHYFANPIDLNRISEEEL